MSACQFALDLCRGNNPGELRPPARCLALFGLALLGLAAASFGGCQSAGDSPAASSPLPTPSSRSETLATAPQAAEAAAAAGRAALAAWQVGESAHGYDQFLALVAPGFRVFSHPTLERGYHTGSAARPRLDALIATRLAQPDRLVFSNVLAVPGPLQADSTRWVVTMFDAAGSTPDNPHFRGYNSIAFLLDAHNRLIGFREYFGDVAPGK